ncbi:NB-ARC domain-containing protein [Amycolatopsis nigrescens]|uniref:NB-ARC domain-containing protein n=1 Tax=Amycolatopsis nigrescens TaxID=381445 RepID=UPI00035F8754|nr:NB-ARC domain-containing protein [Amycolatopsis nigrescens]
MVGAGPRNEFSGSAVQVVQAGSIGTVTFAAPELPPVVPAQVQPPPEGFVDRNEQRRLLRELAELTDPSRKSPVVVVVGRTPGVGKTALLRMAAAELAGLFPDGVLHAAFGPEGDSPAAALGRVLAGLRVPEALVPAGFEPRVDLYRSLTKKSRIMVVLDDVTEAAQVNALLPNSGAAMVLVAGNRALEELVVHGAVPVTLDPLTIEDGIALLSGMCQDDRVGKSKKDSATLVELCGGLPFALRVAGAYLAVRPNRSVGRLTSELRAGAGSGVLDRMLTVFDTVYHALPDRLRSLYRALGVLVGAHFGAEVLAAVRGRPVTEVSADLDQLCLSGLLDELPDGTYGMHRLVRGHALRVAEEEDSEDLRISMLARAVDWWLLGATAADVAATGTQRLRIADPVRLLGTDPVPLDRRAALDWFDRELANILAAMEAAAARAWHDRVWQLFEALFAFLDARRPLDLWVRAAQLAVTSAELAENPAAEARCRCLLGKAYQEWGRYPEAGAELDRARELAARCDDRLQASTFDFTGNLALRERNPAAALEWFRAALDINIRLGTGRGTAMQTSFVGRALAALGEVDEAIATFAGARGLAEAAGEPSLVPRILLDTARTHLDAGDLADAGRVLADANDRATEQDLTALQADIAKHRATVAERTGDHQQARTYRHQAAAIYERMGSPKAARILAGLREDEDLH